MAIEGTGNQSYQISSFTDFLSAHFPDGGTYTQAFLNKVDTNTYVAEPWENFKNKEHVVEFAKKLFKMGEGEFYVLKPEQQEEGIRQLFMLVKEPGKMEGGLLTKHLSRGSIIDWRTGEGVFTDTGSIKVEFNGKVLDCSFFPKTQITDAIAAAGAEHESPMAFDATCIAKDHGRSVVEGRHWTECLPYVWGVGAVYFGGKAVWETGQLCRKVVLPKLKEAKEAAARAANDKEQTKPSAQPNVINVALQVFRERKQIKTPQGETVGTVYSRIATNLALAAICSAGAFLYSACYTRNFVRI